MLQDEHTLKRYDTELEAIRTNILEMDGMIEKQFKNAIQVLAKTNTHLTAGLLIRVSVSINWKWNAMCCNVIARFNPTASDLRLIITATKIIVHLERIGDTTKKNRAYD